MIRRFRKLGVQVVLLLAGIILPTAIALSQNYHQKCRKVSTSSPSVLDSLTVLPSSIHIFSDTDVGFEYHPNTGLIHFSPTVIDSVQVCYQPIPISFHSVVYKRPLTEYDSNAVFKDPPIIRENSEHGLFKTDQIEKSGSIVRGVSMGNQQDVVVNSTMDLELQGKLSDQLNIRAQISDQNIPYQPEGNTQYIQDIDRIFIQVYNDNLSLTAGDITLKGPDDGFLRYNKRVQGGLFEHQQKFGENFNGSVSMAMSVAKGKFASAPIAVSEGLSGPYKIKPPSGESYVFIVANTEKVFLDGRLLERGYDKDYIIDYNQSEITFTARVLISRHSRVKIDFEYADKNYSRSIMAFNHQQESTRHRFFVNYYQEKDNKNWPLSLDLSENEKIALSNAGDDLQMLYASTVDSIGYNENELLYKKSMINGREVFQFSTHPDSATHRVRFMDVGQGNGNYIKGQLTGKGWVYLWQEPVDNAPQGNYEPVTMLAAPTQKSMASFGGAYKVTPHEEVFAEVAFSNQDKNLYSELDAEDNKGIAYRIGLKSSERQWGTYQFHSRFQAESSGKYFIPIDRYQTIEYDRYWNTENMTIPPAEDMVFSFDASLMNEDGNQFKYRGVKRNFGQYLDGTQQSLGVAHHFGKIYVESDYFYAFNQLDVRSSKWNRFRADVNYQGNLFVPGYTYFSEKNAVYTSTDSVISSSGNFHEHMMYLKTQDTLKTSVGLNYGIRTDFMPLAGDIKEQQRSNTISLTLQTPLDKSHVVNSTVAYKKIKALANMVGIKDEEYIAGTLSYSGKFFNNVLMPETDYSITNGRELKREYIFVQVPTGQGHFTWIDDNQDGIQDLTEFYEARFEDERNYAKIFVPTEDYVVAFVNDFNFRLKYEPPASWRNNSGIFKLLSGISAYSVLSYHKKILDTDLWQRLSPFLGNDDTALSFRNSHRYQIFYNRTHPVYGFEYDFRTSRRRQVLTSGFEENDRDVSRVTGRVNIGTGFLLFLHVEEGLSVSSSDFLANRNFEISHQELAPEMEWMAGKHVRITGKLSWMGKTSEEQEHIQKGKAEFKTFDVGLLANASKKMLGANFQFTQIDYQQPENSLLEYEMLDALRPGNNILWRCRMQQELVQGLQLSLNYEGRKPEATKTIHHGRVQLIAYF